MTTERHNHLIETDSTTGVAEEIRGLKMRLGAFKVICEYIGERGWFYVAARLSNGETIKAGRFTYHFTRS